MLDPQLRQVALNRIKVDFRDRQRQAAARIGVVVQDMVNRGLLQSTVAQVEACRVIADEFDIRAQLAWQTFARVIEHAHMHREPALGEAIKNEIRFQLDAHSDDLAQHHAYAASFLSGPSGMRPLEAMRGEAIERVETEIDLFLLTESATTGRAATAATGVSAKSADRPPTAFVSYAWEGEPIKKWAREWAARLRADGVDVTLDQWELVPGDQVPAFMERSVRENDFALIICTPKYKQKSDSRQGGVGYEGDIMTAELMTGRNQRKFIPILRLGEWKDSAPSWLAGKYHIDLRGDPYNEEHYEDLLETLHRRRLTAPPLGPTPFAAASPEVAPVGRATPQTAQSMSARDEPIRILGIVVDEVTSPRNDGTRGSALYAVPFRLSRRPTPEWAEMFVREWDHPSSYTSRHRPGIARVEGDRIILDGTTVEEIDGVHRETLKTVLRDVNSRYEEHTRRAREAEERRRQEAAEHAKRVRDVASRLTFE